MLYELFSHAGFLPIGRGRRFSGFGPKGGRGFGGGGGLPGARKISSADLQLVLLKLLAEQPAHGYELIRILEQRSGGFYTPSPGVIYPALTYLDEIGHVTVEQDGNRKRYQITDDGRRQLDANREAVDAMLDALSRIGRRMDEVRDAFAGLDGLDPNAADDLHRARRGLKHALMRTRDCTPAEARRITLIVHRATAAILNAVDEDQT